MTRYTIDEAISKNLLISGDLVFIGKLFPETHILLSAEGYACRRYHVCQEIDTSYGKFEKIFPVGFFIMQNDKWFIESSIKNYKNRETSFFMQEGISFLNNKDFGITTNIYTYEINKSIAKIVSSTDVFDGNSKYNQLEKGYCLRIEFPNNFLVSFQGKLDFPVFELPVHKVYV